MTNLSPITAQLEAQAIESPSWAFSNSGTRFEVLGSPGTPRDPFEEFIDAAQSRSLIPRGETPSGMEYEAVAM